MSSEITGSLRADGATRGDRNEAIALVVGGATLLVFPLVVAADRLSEVWFWVAAFVATGATLVLGLGLRWFLMEGPSLGAVAKGALNLDAPGGQGSFPRTVRLVEARNRLRAHSLRFAALGSGLVLLVVDLGVVGWLVVVLFLLSFVADHVLLRPKRYQLDEKGFRGMGRLTMSELSWEAVERVFWRRYPGKERPPFPGGERLVIETRNEEDVEFVFSRRYGGSECREVVQAMWPVLGERLQVLEPRDTTRVEVDAPTVSDLLIQAAEIREQGPPPTAEGGESPSLPAEAPEEDAE